MPEHSDYASLARWCREAPLDAGTSVVEADYWGFFAANALTSASWFAWFPTRFSLLRYLSDCWPFDYHDAPDALEAEPRNLLAAARYGVAARRYDAGELDEELYLALLSDAHPGVTVYWVGTFGELLDGEASFCREWRAQFRGLDVVDGDYPIKEDEVGEVLQVLAWE